MDRRMRPRHARLALVWMVAAACGGERAVEPALESPAAAPRGASREVAAGPAGARAGASVDEASARVLIAGRFRAAGFRVVEDVVLREGGVEVTLDGFDPARRVGYEYVAAEERGADLDEGERERLAGLPGVRVLVIDGGEAGAVAGAVDRFLGELPASAP